MLDPEPTWRKKRGGTLRTPGETAAEKLIRVLQTNKIRHDQSFSIPSGADIMLGWREDAYRIHHLPCRPLLRPQLPRPHHTPVVKRQHHCFIEEAPGHRDGKVNEAVTHTLQHHSLEQACVQVSVSGM